MDTDPVGAAPGPHISDPIIFYFTLRHLPPPTSYLTSLPIPGLVPFLFPHTHPHPHAKHHVATHYVTILEADSVLERCRVASQPFFMGLKTK